MAETNTGPRRETITVRLPERWKRILETQATVEGVTVSDLIFPKIREAVESARNELASAALEGVDDA